MRRYPLTRRRSRLVGAMLVAPLLAGCGAQEPPATDTSPAAVTISSAPGATLAFDPAESTVRATGPIDITFHNRSSLPHNLVFTGKLTGATRTIVEPGTSDQLQLASPTPGDYSFACTIHDGMRGTLIVLEATAAMPGPGLLD